MPPRWPRPVTIVDAGVRKTLDLSGRRCRSRTWPRSARCCRQSSSPVAPAAAPDARSSIWPQIHPRILELIRAHRSTIVFVNSRRLAERLALRLNELAGEELVRAHHGRLAREERLQIEERLKAGRLPALVATSRSSWASTWARSTSSSRSSRPAPSRAGCSASAGPATRSASRPGASSSPSTAATCSSARWSRARMHDGEIEPTRHPAQPARRARPAGRRDGGRATWPVDDLSRWSAAPRTSPIWAADPFEATLDMLAGHYPGDEFAELRPRVIWDRATGRSRAAATRARCAVINGGTIPDRGLFGVFLAADGDLDAGARRLPSAERRPARRRARRGDGLRGREGEVILLGASAWRIEQITRDRVLVSARARRAGQGAVLEGRWAGPAGRARPRAGRVHAAARRRRRRRARPGAAEKRCARSTCSTQLAARNLVDYLAEEQAATGALPTDRTIVRGALPRRAGRLARLPAHAVRRARARALGAGDRGALCASGWHRGPADLERRRHRRSPADERRAGARSPDPDAAGVCGGRRGSGPDRIRRRRGAGHRRAGRHGAVLEPLPRERRAGAAAAASPRGRARRCGSSASARPSCWPWPAATARFPIVLETYRECLQDVFDLPALRGILAAIERREIRVVSVETRRASPFASSLVFDYVAAYMYEGDAPPGRPARPGARARPRPAARAARRARSCASCSTATPWPSWSSSCSPGWTPERGRLADAVHDLLRRLGDLAPTRSPPGCAARTTGPARAPPGSGSRRSPPTGAR